MTVGELKELLDDYGDHLEVRIVNNDWDTDEGVAIEDVESYTLFDGAVVTISFSTN